MLTSRALRVGVVGVVLGACMGASSVAEAAEHYVRAGASGDGSDWLNASPALPTNMVRGDTYYVASGDYADDWSLSTPASGTQTITVKKATSTDHGAGANWQDSFGVGPATFPFLWIQTSYWTIDGVTGSGSDASSYGFAARTVAGPGDEIYVFISAGNVATFEGITVRHVAATCTGPSKNVGQQAFVAGTQSDVVAATFQAIYADNCSNSVVIFGDQWLIEGSYFGRAWSSPEHHGEQIDILDANGSVGTIFRNNVIAQCAGTTCIGNGDVASWQIYGNVFRDIETGNGVIGSSGSSRVFDTKITNNTIVDNHSTSFLYQNNPGAGQGSGNIVQNNLFYASNAGLAENGGGPIAHDYNAVFGDTLDEPHGQTLSGDPFVGLSTFDFRLKAHTDPGIALGAPYDVDPLGNARVTWDRGAYEFCEGNCAMPPDPSTTSSTASSASTSVGSSGAGGGASGGEGDSGCACRFSTSASSHETRLGLLLAGCLVAMARRRRVRPSSSLPR